MYKIYKIIDNTNDNIYIGITKQKYLSQRIRQHKHKSKKGTNNCMSHQIIKNGDYKIELIEETDDKTRERYWIKNINCINKQIPGRTLKEWREDNKDDIAKKIQINHLKNREKNLENMKKRNQIIRPYEISWGGRIDRDNNSLLKIDPNLFNHPDL